MTETRTTCPYCGVGCGVVASADGEKVSIRGDETHPANFGRLCVKGSALGETTGLQGRLLRPVVDGREVAWPQALGEAGERLRNIINEWGPQAVAFYASGQLLTEDYYAANKLMKGFIGAAVKTWCRAATRTWKTAIWWYSLARTRPGRIRCCISGWCRQNTTIRR